MWASQSWFIMYLCNFVTNLPSPHLPKTTEQKWKINCLQEDHHIIQLFHEVLRQTALETGVAKKGASSKLNFYINVQSLRHYYFGVFFFLTIDVVYYVT